MIRVFISILATLCFLGYSKPDMYDYPKSVPEDFSISLTWGCYGVSSYESKTGKLIKTTDTTHTDDYVTYYQLTDADKAYIYDLIVSMDVLSYPDVYNPQEDNYCSPSETLILDVTFNGVSKEIKAEDICGIGFTSESKKGQKFLSTCQAIITRLEETKEWKALPEFEFFYE